MVVEGGEKKVVWLALMGPFGSGRTGREPRRVDDFTSDKTAPKPGSSGTRHWEGRWVATPYLSSVFSCLFVSPVVVSHHPNTGYHEGKISWQFLRTLKVPEAPGTVPFLSFSEGTHKHNTSLCLIQR